MFARSAIAVAALGLSAAGLAAGSPLELVSRVTKDRRVAAKDGTVRIVEVPATGAAPGDRLTVTLAYRNTGNAPLTGIQLANPVPAGLAYRGVAAGAPEPEVSADGERFAPLARLSIASVAGGNRAATADDVTHVRWRLDRPVAPGTGGSLGFRAVVK